MYTISLYPLSIKFKYILRLTIEKCMDYELRLTNGSDVTDVTVVKSKSSMIAFLDYCILRTYYLKWKIRMRNVIIKIILYISGIEHKNYYTYIWLWPVDIKFILLCLIASQLDTYCKKRGKVGNRSVLSTVVVDRMGSL